MRIGKAAKLHPVKEDPARTLGRNDGDVLASRPRGEGAIAQSHGKRLLLGAGDIRGERKPLQHTILKGHIMKRTVAAPHMPEGM